MLLMKMAPPLQQLVLPADALPADVRTTGQTTGVLDIHFHPWQQSHIFIQGQTSYYWVTRDYGATYKAYRAPGHAFGEWMEIKIHPRVPDWILAKVRRGFCMQELFSTRCAHDLFVSKVSSGPFYKCSLRRIY